MNHDTDRFDGFDHAKHRLGLLALMHLSLHFALFRRCQVSYASLCMDSGDLEETLGEKQQALAKIEHAVAQRHLSPPKVFIPFGVAIVVIVVIPCVKCKLGS